MGWHIRRGMLRSQTLENTVHLDPLDSQVHRRCLGPAVCEGEFDSRVGTQNTCIQGSIVQRHINPHARELNRRKIPGSVHNG